MIVPYTDSNLSFRLKAFRINIHRDQTIYLYLTFQFKELVETTKLIITRLQMLMETTKLIFARLQMFYS